MVSLIVRYGALLALFLVAAETVRRSYISQHSDIELYMGTFAVAFLVLGFLLARKTKAKPPVEQTPNTASLSVLDKQDFSDRELDVLLFLCHGYSNSEIAEQLGVKTNTVKTHLKNIYSKLDVNNRTQAAAEAKIAGIIG